jgi:2-iminoacetate synthase ThiH
MRRFTLLCDDRQARRVERLAARYGLTEREVLRQLLDLGLDSLDPGAETTDDREGALPD